MELEGSLAFPPWSQPRGNLMVSSVNPHTNATSKRCHLCKIKFTSALNSTPVWLPCRAALVAVRLLHARKTNKASKVGLSEPETLTPTAFTPTPRRAVGTRVMTCSPNRQNRRGFGGGCGFGGICATELAASKQTGNTLKDFKDFNLKAKARIWP